MYCKTNYHFIHFFISILAIVCFSTNVWANSLQKDSDHLFSIAKEEIDRKNYSEALIALNIQKSLGIKLPKTYRYYYGTALMGIGDYDNALKVFNQYLSQGTKAKFYTEAKQKYEVAQKRGVWVDPSTRLMWQDDESVTIVKLTWNDAQKYCENMSFLGYDNWELPVENTLKDLFKKKESLQYFSKEPYWADMTLDYVSGEAYNVDFNHGSLSKAIRYKDTMLVRCVRHIPHNGALNGTNN